VQTYNRGFRFIEDFIKVKISEFKKKKLNHRNKKNYLKKLYLYWSINKIYKNKKYYKFLFK